MRWELGKAIKRNLKIGLIVVCIGSTIVGNIIYAEDQSLDKDSNDSNSSEIQTAKPESSQDNTSPISEDTSIAISPVKNLLSLANQFYSDFTKGKKIKFPNENMGRMHRFALTYDPISRAHFSRGVIQLPSQRKIPELIDYALRGDWLEQVTRMTSDPIYGYSESRALRIFVGSHAAAHFYDIPYPTLFCPNLPVLPQTDKPVF